MTDLRMIGGLTETKVAWISAAERDREVALLSHFASFWGTATGAPRAVYDKFIAASPMADGASFEIVATGEVEGWGVRPAHRPVAGLAVLFVHGGGYVQGTAEA